jgi:site-specific DNA recombinase
VRALVYTRVSQDRAEGRSPAEQEAESRALCAREGWEVVEVVTDSVGASRYSKGTRRGWARAKTLLAEGKVDVLVTWEASRADRDLAAYAELRDLCVTHGILWSYSGRTHDLSTADDRFKTGLDALLAEREVDQSRERIMRAMRANAAAGKPHGRRLYGYQRVYEPPSGVLVGQEPHPTEAPVVHRIYTEYLKGRGIRTIAAGLNAEGVTTGTGAAWTDSQIRRLLTNPSYAGLRTHRGEIIGAGVWEPLVPPAQFDRVQARLSRLARSKTRQTNTARLLTGVARCGVCGSKLMVGHDRNRRKVYQCRQGFHVSRDEEMVDQYVGSAVLRRLEGGVPEEEPVEDPHRKTLDDLHAQLAEFQQGAIDGTVTAASFATIEAGLRERIRAEEAALRRSVIPLDLDVPEGPLDDWWEAKSPEERRALVGAVVVSVTVHRLPRRGRRGEEGFEPEFIHVEFR